jgi:hypothetical protein
MITMMMIYIKRMEETAMELLLKRQQDNSSSSNITPLMNESDQLESLYKEYQDEAEQGQENNEDKGEDFWDIDDKEIDSESTILLVSLFLLSYHGS